MLLTTDLVERLMQGLGGAANAPLGLAVSGGGDSIALLHLAVAAGLPVQAATVDHGLRTGSDAEAAGVAATCSHLGVPHRTLRWHWDGKGNLQDQARRARLALLAEWARGQGLAVVALAHTRDDLAETFLMRLARGSGVDGLSAMAPDRLAQGIRWVRPLLDVARSDLRDWLQGQGIAWVDDPSNENDRFDRVKARRVLAALAPLGLDAARLAEVAGHLSQVRAALNVQTQHAAASVARLDRGDVVLDGAGFAALPDEIRRRLLQAAIQWIASAEYGARGPQIARLRDQLAKGRSATLAGCRFLTAKGMIRITREAGKLQGLRVPIDALWDGRWHLHGPENKGLAVGALGAKGLLSCPDWRAAGLPRATLLASPAVWFGDDLIAAPLAGFGPGWQASCTMPPEPLSSAPLSH